MTDKKPIVFYVEPDEYDIVMFNAKSKGFNKAGDYTRSVLFGHINKYPCKGIFASLNIHKYPKAINVEYTPKILGSENK